MNVKEIATTIPISNEMLEEAEYWKAKVLDAFQTHFELMNAREVKIISSRTVEDKQ